MYKLPSGFPKTNKKKVSNAVDQWFSANDYIRKELFFKGKNFVPGKNWKKICCAIYIYTPVKYQFVNKVHRTQICRLRLQKHQSPKKGHLEVFGREKHRKNKENFQQRNCMR